MDSNLDERPSLSERSPSRLQLSDQELTGILADAKRRYSDYYGSARDFSSVTFLSTAEEVYDFFEGMVGAELQRGFVEVAPKPVYSENGNKVIGIDGFEDPKLIIIKGDYRLDIGLDPREIFSEILSHELIHAQVSPVVIVGTVDPILTPEDIDYHGNIAYVSGFKVADINPETGNPKPITQSFNEFIVQYLTMSMRDAFNNPSAALSAISQTGRGITREFISGARILNNLFGSLGIDAKQVEKFYRSSDLKGLLDLIGEKRNDMKIDFVNLLSFNIDRSTLTFLEGMQERHGINS